MGTPARFHEADLKRALVATAKSGLRDYRVNVLPDGTISIIVGAAARQSARGNSCDDLLP